ARVVAPRDAEDVLHDAAEERAPVLLVEDRERRLDAGRARVEPEETRREGVKCRYQHVGGREAHRLDPPAHLARGLVRERDREEARRIGAGRDEVRDPPRDDAGLPGAGAGEDEERAARVRDGLALLGIEIGEEVHRREAAESSTGRDRRRLAWARGG